MLVGNGVKRAFQLFQGGLRGGRARGGASLARWGRRGGELELCSCALRFFGCNRSALWVGVEV